jgi:hypothetical protein
VRQPSDEERQRTRAIARVIGPFLTVATVVIAIRLPDVNDMLNALFASPVLPWMLGAGMLLIGLVVIAYHQYWYSLTAALISLFGWFVALRGLTLMATPSAIESGADTTLASTGMLLAARIFFVCLTGFGLWLTYLGWVQRSGGRESSEPKSVKPQRRSRFRAASPS